MYLEESFFCDFVREIKAAANLITSRIITSFNNTCLPFDFLRRLLDPASNFFCFGRIQLSTMELVASEKIEGNNDLLMSILVRLPPKSLFRFKCASKRWNNIIADPCFLKSYSAKTRKHWLRGERLLPLVQLTSVNAFRKSNLGYITLVPNQFGNFITSSNGLVLCGDHDSSNTYHVWNPITKKSVSLPPPIIPNSTRAIIPVAFVCEENTNELKPNYMVLRASIDTLGECDIETYSSKTGTWAKLTLRIPPYFYLSEETPSIVCNGVVHWSGRRSIALYDLNGGEDRLQLIMLPFPDSDTYYNSTIIRPEHDDVIWFSVTDVYQGMQFWRLPKNKDGSYRRSTIIPANEWILMHTITSASLLKEPAIKLLENNEETDEILKSIFIEGLIPCSPIVVVLRQGENVFLYNLETKTIESLQYDGGRPTEWWYPYMESHCLSSYAL
ncbi:hypothetical protein ACJIZ3_023876 [Penstemon smallii]|uniref:F-box domain-containing protein n=1 Tax=Penstemon smallii TaxID=265156 RepID=A0ABD3TQF8_9LAMI